MLIALEQVGKQNVTFDKGFSIQDMPVSSAILSPKDKEVIIHDGYVHCEGYVLISSLELRKG
jgi:sulfite oxidase